LPVLKDFNREALGELASRVQYVDVRAGETLFKEGDSAEAMYIVVSGGLEALVSHNTRKKTVVGEMLPGTPVGEIALLLGGKRNATVKAKEDSVLVMLTRDKFDAIVKKYKGIRKQLLDVVLHRLRKTQWMNILTSYFGEIDEETHSFLRSRFEWVHVKKNCALFEKGDAGDSMYILVNGLLQAVNTDENGAQKVIGRITQGEIAGEMAIITGEKRAASVYAVRESDLVRLSKASFEEISRQYPRIMMEITRILVNRLKNVYAPQSQGYTSVTMAVVPVHDNRLAGECVTKLEKAFSKIGSTKVINSVVLSDQFGIKDIAQVPENDPRSIGLIAWLEEQERTHSFVIYQAEKDRSNWSGRCLSHADQVLYIADFKHLHSSGGILKEAVEGKSQKQAAGAKKLLIFIHDGETAIPGGTGALINSLQVSGFHHIRKEKQPDFERLARIISNRAIGLVLGGGGAKGIAHIGVIRALEEAGVPIDMVGGSSIGSIIAGMYAMGRSHDEMIALSRKMFIEIDPLHEYTLPLISLLRSKRAFKMAEAAFGDTWIEDLWINYFCISCNLSRSAVKVHRKGHVGDATRASSSLPGIAVPVLFDKEVHVDGGVINNLPGDVMRQQCGTVIVVQLGSVLDSKTEFDEFPSPWRLLFNRLVPFTKRIDVPNILDILMSTIGAGSTMHTKQVMESADLCLVPPVNHVGMLAFKKLNKIADIGYRYTKEVIGKIDDPELLKRIVAGNSPEQ
jgi:NTE family protein/lysophospholipid hydrolase